MKEQLEGTKEEFIMSLKKNYEHLLQSQEELRKWIANTEKTLNVTSNKTMQNGNFITEMQKRAK